MSPTPPFTVLIAGATLHAEWYAEAISQRSDMTLVGFVDSDDTPPALAARLPILAKNYGVPHARISCEALSPNADVILIATEPTRRAPILEWAVRQSMHFVIDKPIATSYQVACSFVALADESRLTSTYVHRCFSPAISSARAHIDRGAIGLPRLAHCVFVPSYHHKEDDVGRLAVDPVSSGGGEIMNFLGYVIDYLDYLIGLRVEAVFATATALTSSTHSSLSVESFGLLSLTLEKGVIASVTVGRSPAGERLSPGRLHLTVSGSLGTIHTDETRPSLDIRSPHYEGDSNEVGSIAFHRLLDDFVSSIREGRQPLRILRNAADHIAVIEAAYASLISRQKEVVRYG